MCSVVRGSPLGSPPTCPPWPPRSAQPLGMGLCGLGLLSDNLGKILGRTGGATLWRSGHPRKPHLASGPQVPRSAEGPTLQPLSRSVPVPGCAGKEEEGTGSCSLSCALSQVWGLGQGWRLRALISLEVCLSLLGLPHTDTAVVSSDLTRPNQISPHVCSQHREGRIGVGLGLLGRLLPCHRSQAFPWGTRTRKPAGEAGDTCKLGAPCPGS